MTVKNSAVEKTATEVNVYLTRNQKMRVCRIWEPKLTVRFSVRSHWSQVWRGHWAIWVPMCSTMLWRRYRLSEIGIISSKSSWNSNIRFWGFPSSGMWRCVAR